MKIGSKGFTIIELIVVIAIIAVLASVVIASITIYIGRANDAAVKVSLSQIAKKYQIQFGENNSYVMPTKPDVTLPCAQSQISYGVNADVSAFAAYAKLCTSDTYWCIDSAGKSVDIGATPPDAVTYSCVGGISVPSVCDNKGSDDICSPPGDACCSYYTGQCQWTSGCVPL